MEKFENLDFFKLSNFLKYLLFFQVVAIILSFFPSNHFFSFIIKIFYCIYCLLLPGILILGLLKVKKITVSYFIPYSVAISTIYLIIVGFLINIFFPLLGNMHPFSTSVIRYSIFFSLLFLSLLLCFLNCNYNPISFSVHKIKNLISPFSLITILLPLISIIGTYLIIYHKSNWLLLLLLIIISIIPIFLRKFIPKFVYPYLIFSIGLALMLHNSLASPFIQGSDLNSEYYFSKLVIQNSFWDMSVMHSHNTLLSDVILAPIISIFCNLQLVWIFKIIYPLLFSFGIVALYQIISEQAKEEIAFYSCFFVLSIFLVYTELLQLSKQMVAEFFLCFLILSLFTDQLNSDAKRILSIIFIFAIIVSHYGLTYILITMFFCSILLASFLSKFGFTKTKRSISLDFLLFSVVTSVCWYIYVGSSSVFNSVTTLSEHVTSQVFDSLVDVESNSPQYWLTIQISPLEQILKYLYIFSVLFMVIGLVYCFFSIVVKGKNKMVLEYFLLALSAMVWLAVSLIIPSLVSQGSIGFSRMYQISSIFLSPFLIIGIQVSANKILIFIKSRSILKIFSYFKDGKIIIPIFLTVFLILNSFVLAEILKENNFDEHSISPSISQIRINEKGTVQERATINSYNKAIEDIFGVYWLEKFGVRNKKILVDSSSTAQIFTSYGSIYPDYQNPDARINFLSPDQSIFIRKIQNGNYVFLRKLNTKDGIMKIDFWQGSGNFENYPTGFIQPVLENLDNRIYENGQTIVYKS